MALPLIAKATYPNVPTVAGIPPVLRQLGAIQNRIVLLVGIGRRIASIFAAGPQWGLFDQNGQAVLTGSSVQGVDVRRQWRVADFPIEQGGFANYNKVAAPTDVRFTFAQGGSEAERRAFLNAVNFAAGNLYLYVAMTPEVFYPSVNVTHYDYRREAKAGAALLTVDVWLQEVRLVGPTRYTDTQAPSGAEQRDQGTLQLQTQPYSPLPVNAST